MIDSVKSITKIISIYFNRLETTNQDTPIECSNQVQGDSFNQLQSIQMTEKLNATRTPLETSFTYSYHIINKHALIKQVFVQIMKLNNQMI